MSRNMAEALILEQEGQCSQSCMEDREILDSGLLCTLVILPGLASHID